MNFDEFYNWMMEDAQSYLASKLLDKSSAPASANSSGWYGYAVVGGLRCTGPVGMVTNE